MKIVADENIPFAREAYGTLGDVTLAHGRSLSTEQLAETDLLFVRSITKVKEELLSGTPVQFVGTATAGVDHIDQDYLASAGVGFSAASGCNANSVAEYMTAAWLTVAARKGLKLRGMKLGVVGVGAVGTRVEAKARALGMDLVLNDPPKERESGDHERYSPIDDVFDCDIVTCHTPLTKDGLDPTHHLVNQSFFDRLKDGAIFCNAGRGEVVDEAALHRAMDAGKLTAVILDVFENEPSVDPKLLDRIDISSPHIAGYSYDGKINGTTMILEAACQHLGVASTFDAQAAMRAPEFPELTVDAAGRNEEDVLREIVTTLYPIERDDATLRATIAMTPEERGVDFDRQRKQYPYRREFTNTKLTLQNASDTLRATVAGIGFDLQA